MNEISSTERQSDGTAAPEPEFKQEAERRLPCTSCCASCLDLARTIGAQLGEGFKQHGIPTIVEDTEHGFALRLGGDVMTSLVISIYGDKPDVGVSSYAPSCNREITERIFRQTLDVKNNPLSVEPILKSEGA